MNSSSSSDYEDSSLDLESSFASDSDEASGTGDSSLSSAGKPFRVEDAVVRVRMIPSGSGCPPVVYKHDGRRFKHLNTPGSTIKLREGMEYGIVISITPELSLRCQQMTLTSYDMVKDDEIVFSEDNVTLYPCMQGYCCRWICELPVSEVGQRRKMTATLNVEGFGSVTIPLMAKVYSVQDRKGSMNGSPLLSVSYKFGAGNWEPKSSNILRSIDYVNAPWRL